MVGFSCVVAHLVNISYYHNMHILLTFGQLSLKIWCLLSPLIREKCTFLLELIFQVV